MTNTYIAAEPAIVEAFQDQKGRLHGSREAAIDANFADDFAKAVIDYCKQEAPDMPVFGGIALVKSMAEQHPDLLRVLIGDRDAT